MAHIPDFWIDGHTSKKNNRHQCCGCTACESVCTHKAISIHPDQEGFKYPRVDESICVDCGLCLKVCPVANKCEVDDPYVKSYGGYSTDKKVIDACASGGIATALSIDTINKGGVVFGVRFNDEYKESEFCIARTEEELWKFCSSKYIQPKKIGIYKQVQAEIKKNIPVLFVGCPCDIAALNRYLRKDYDNLLTCELFCAGITSPKILDSYIAFKEHKLGSQLTGLCMRNKEHGWFVSHMKEKYANGKIESWNYYGTYMGYAFLTFRRPSCYHCQYKQNITYCDIKVGDFWGIKDTDPYWNPKGVSVILAKTQNGVNALESLSDFTLCEIEYAKATINNGGFMGVPGDALERRREQFEKVFITEGKGLEAACKVTAPMSFWIKYYVPSSWQTTMKKIYHKIIDKK